MGRRKAWTGARLYTIGHSTRTLEELASLLRGFEVGILVDVRSFPRSRSNPQFNTDVLPDALRPWELRYAHLPKLGGRRRARPDSSNTGWRNTSFRGYADHMLTAEFEAGLSELQQLLEQGTPALMCAEAVPWRCHRSLIADALTARGAQVIHLTGNARAAPHRMTPFALVEGGRVTYPGTPQLPLELERS